jgi:uncharacterized damage-inducible protein DinB
MSRDLSERPERNELTAREAEAWASFVSLLESLPADRRETPELDDGWSVKDVLWHVAYWWDDLAERLTSGNYEEDGETDARNARELERSRAMSWLDVSAGLAERRERMLAAWVAEAEPAGDPQEWFESETIEHYDEHGPQLRALATDPRKP